MQENRIRYEKTDNPEVINMVVEKKIEEKEQKSLEQIQKYVEENFLKEYNENVDEMDRLQSQIDEKQKQIESLQERNEELKEDYSPELEIIDYDLEEEEDE